MTSRQTFSNLARLSLCALLVAGLTACASTQPPGQQVDDAAVTAKVKSKLAADPEVNPFNIDVDTDEGVVRLSGKVEKAAARSEAERLARNTEGVRRVINDVTVGKTTVGERVDDAALASKVKAKITADPDLNPFNIDVDSEDGVITLSGRVESRQDSQHAEQIAARTSGVRSVRNMLKVGDLAGGE